MCRFDAAINWYIIKYTTTNLPMKLLNTWFIDLMKVSSALVNPKGRTKNSYKPNLLYPFILIINNMEITFGENNYTTQLV
jgi:hypothetical protein